MKQYVVDAFTDKVFSGNPAAISVFDKWPSDELLQKIAWENNLSESAYLVQKEPGRYHLRWFTLNGEIDLCGHATMASAYTVVNYLEPGAEKVVFETLSGELIVDREGDLLKINFPSFEMEEKEVTEEIAEALGGARPVRVFLGADLVCEFETEEEVRAVKEDQEKVKALDGLLCHITAPGNGEFDCVTRTFAPKCNMPEDPFCGRGHCHVVPFWAKRLGKENIHAYQASPRGGEAFCTDMGERVELAGKGAIFSIDEMFLPEE